jgi:endonuclease/exonuclease/phosphatase family metal-dependent hydrolase
MELRALTWNLFHGRDFPPDASLLTTRSRLLRIPERNATHLQVNGDLFDEFATVLGAARWDLALLQECPPRWSDRLAGATSAQPHRVLTSRNSLAWLRALAARINPDLIASNEGGSNLTLVRGARLTERRELELRPGPKPERRTMAFSRALLADDREICIANLHASAGRALRAEAEEEVLTAATRATEWAGAAPLVFGGDLNLRPRDSAVYETLERDLDLAQPTAPGALDHLLVRRLEILEPPAAWPSDRREVRVGRLAIRLSDHAPVEAAFG